MEWRDRQNPLAIDLIKIITFFRYDVKLNQWTEVASLTKDRMYAATAILSGIIFAIGGEDSSTTTTNSVECYVPEANKWVSISPMIQKRSAPGSGVANNILYVYGGGLWGKSLDTFEKYDSNEDKWTLVIVFRSCKQAIEVT